jgi:HEAT repeat protein
MRRGIRKQAIRRQLQAVADGKSTVIPIDAAEARFEGARAIEEITSGFREDSFQVQLLQVAFKNSGVADRVIDHLAVKSVHERAAGARLVGALRMYEAIPWLSPLLSARDRSVADSAARALGRIGGPASATALLLAIQRRGLNRRLVCELARGAPDLFIETALAEPQRPGVRPGLAVAAGLRRRRTAITPLIALLERGSRRERVISCRALGWIGAGTAIPIIRQSLYDRDWKIRMSAAKALGALRAGSCRRDLEQLYDDRNPKVRKAARHAVRRMSYGA